MAETIRDDGDRKVARHEFAVDVDAVHLEKMHHTADLHGFTIESDEPAAIGGEDRHPYPLEYFVAAVAF